MGNEKKENGGRPFFIGGALRVTKTDTFKIEVFQRSLYEIKENGTISCSAKWDKVAGTSFSSGDVNTTVILNTIETGQATAETMTAQKPAEPAPPS